MFNQFLGAIGALVYVAGFWRITRERKFADGDRPAHRRFGPIGGLNLSGMSQVWLPRLWMEHDFEIEQLVR